MNRNSPLPLYRQVEDALRARMESGELSPGDRLPTETELARSLGVNRLTVRQAIAELNRAGLVQARQGVGTFVTQPPMQFTVELDPTRWDAVAERTEQAMVDSGFPAPVREIPVGHASGVRNETARAELRLGDERLASIDTVSAADDPDEPWVVSTYLFSEDRFPRLAELFDRNTPLFRVLRDHFGIAPLYGWRSFGAGPASPRDAEVLGVPTGTPVLLREGVNVDADGTPLIYVSRRCRSDRVRFVLRYGQGEPGSAEQN